MTKILGECYQLPTHQDHLLEMLDIVRLVIRNPYVVWLVIRNPFSVVPVLSYGSPEIIASTL